MAGEQGAADADQGGRREQPQAGPVRVASTPTTAGPAVKLISSTVPSSQSADVVASGSPAASRTQRLRESGPTSGTDAPIRTAQPVCAASGSPAVEAATSATIAAALTAAATSPTPRWPRRSASRPTRGPPTAWATASAPVTAEPRQTLPESWVTSSRAPIGHIALGSRPSSDQSSTRRPVSRVVVRNLVRAAIADPSSRTAAGRPPPGQRP
ncbi:hypothetical protein GCM10025734_65300 [Kitasatospora paranensis]|uniref:hypothetical protein n=1 Tax=Kitasatospora paranensis TaxID=258053 RepID=UPI0031EE820E